MVLLIPKNTSTGTMKEEDKVGEEAKERKDKNIANI